MLRRLEHSSQRTHWGKIWLDMNDQELFANVLARVACILRVASNKGDKEDCLLAAAEAHIAAASRELTGENGMFLTSLFLGMSSLLKIQNSSVRERAAAAFEASNLGALFRSGHGRETDATTNP